MASRAEKRIRELALSFPDAYEDSPWGHPVFKVEPNRMFASMSVSEGEVLLTVKLTAEEREVAHRVASKNDLVKRCVARDPAKKRDARQ